MSAEQIIVLVLLVAAFAAGRLSVSSRDPDDPPAEEDDVGAIETPGVEPPVPDDPSPESPMVDEDGDLVPPPPPHGEPAAFQRGQTPLEHAEPVVRALERAAAAYESAIDRWLDEGDAISPAGKASLGELDRAIGRLATAVERLDGAGSDAATARVAGGALDALREARELLDGFRDGRTIDAGISRELDGLEDDVEAARERLRATVTS